MENKKFLPMSEKEMQNLGLTSLDFILVTGDAYIDHPSFSGSIIARVLEDAGYTVGIIAQPNWKSPQEFMKLGRPNLGFLVTAGNMDSMINHYTAAKKRRGKDLYSPNGETDMRPDRATLMYVNKIKQVHKGVPVIIGGVEASLRRFVHYDYWSNSLKKSILLDSKADLLIYGMGEKAAVQIAHLLEKGVPVGKIRDIHGTCYLENDLEAQIEGVEIPSFESINEDKKLFAEAFIKTYREQNPFLGKRVYQKQGNRILVQNPPMEPLTTKEMDAVYNLPFTKKPHPRYERLGKIPAIEEVKFSITSHRGCFGGCAFCSITFHQGKIIQERSHDSIIKEAKEITNLDDFKGYIHDIGGPTANFRKPSCGKQMKAGTCKDKECLFPDKCENMEFSNEDFISLLKKVRNLDKIKKVFVRSGIRFDYLMYDKKGKEILREIVMNHISGQMKVAPEHISDQVLSYMQKPGNEVYENFKREYEKINKKNNLKQFLVPYLISSHPGSTLKDAVMLAEYIRDMDYNPEQVQDFIPTPGSMATVMYYSGYDPRTMKKIFIERNMENKLMQRALIQYRDPKNYDLVYKALMKLGRRDLIGFGPKALIKPRNVENKKRAAKGKPDFRKDDKRSDKRDNRRNAKRDSSKNKKSKGKARRRP